MTMKRISTILVFAGGFTAAIVAQTVSGFISGTITDSSGAVITDAKITLINESNGGRRETTSNDSGDYTFTSVQPGSYSLMVERTGFKQFRRTTIVLAANERLPQDVQMEVGGASETINVEARGDVVQTNSAERSATVTAQQLSTLTLKGRDFMGLLKLLPGVTDKNARESPTNNSLTGLNIQGNREGVYNLTLDGVTNVDTGSNTGPYFEPSADSIAEVHVLLTNYQAEYGRNAGGQINVVTRSGSRQYHGSAYYYKRNEGLNANNFFANRSGLPRSRYRYDLFGYTLGGPAAMPHVFEKTRQKLFFFWAQEFQPTKLPNPLGQLTVPTALERQGDFSRTVQSDGRLIAITDATNGQQFPGNVVPKSRISPNGQALLNIFPLPDTLGPGGQYNYIFQTTTNDPRHVELLRLDYVINASTTFYIRGIHSHEQFEGGQGFVGISANWPQFDYSYSLGGRGISTNLTKIINSTTVNEFTFGVNRGIQDRKPLSDAALARDQRATQGLESLGQFHPEINPLGILPNATFGGVPNAINLMTELKFPFIGRNNIWNFTDNFSAIRGNHTLKFGMYFEPTARNARFQSTFNGQFDFQRNPNNPLDTGWAWSNALVGNFYSYLESNHGVFGWGRFKNLEFYAQDTWKASKRLTLDYGLRFSWLPPNYSAHDNVASFVPALYVAGRIPSLFHPASVNGVRVGQDPRTGGTVPAVLIGGLVPGTGDPYNGIVVASQTPSYPRGLINSRGLQYGPRFGFAYDVIGNGKTAIRGGFGLFYDRILTDEVLEMTANPPLEDNPLLYYGNLNSYLQSQSTLFPGNVLGLTRSGEVPNVMNWSFGAQQGIFYNTLLDVAYVGSAARHLMADRNLNLAPYGANFLPQNGDPTTPGKPLPMNFLRPYRGYGNINVRDFSSTSNYHSLQLRANRRFAKSIQYGVAWTWSKAMDFADTRSTLLPTYAPLRAWMYGKAGFDRTHNLVISYIWDLPGFTGRQFLLRNLLNRWQWSGIMTFQSGSPLGVGMTTTDNADIAGGGDGVRTVVLTNPILARGDRTLTRFFNTAAFARPEQGTYGNAPRDVIRGPGLNNWDISVVKSVALGSELRLLQLRGEFYNAWNHTQFTNVDTTAQFNPAGQQVNARFGALTAANPARVAQIAIRVTF
jgi:hypothetical protein